jgi:hypothetical protein
VPKRVELLKVSDFTSGLNLTDDPFKLGKGESADLMNVDLDGRGGVRQRRGVTEFGSGTTVLAGDPMFIDEHVATDGTKRLIYGQGQSVFYVSKASPGAATAIPWFLGGSWPTGAPGTYGGPFRTAAFESNGTRRIYVQRNAEHSACYISSITSSSSIDVFGMATSGPTWQDAYTVVTPNSMPKAKTLAAHQGYMWVANTVENGVKYPNRLRWSHPNVPAAWRTNDYLDLSGLDGDEITAVASNGDHLLVFQRNATHAIYGYDPATFQNVTVSTTVGAVSQEAVVATSRGTYAFDAKEGVFLHRGRVQPELQFARLGAAMLDGRIVRAQLAADTRLGWIDGRLWVTVPYQETSEDSIVGTTFVLDPDLSKEGSWTRYSLSPKAYFTDIDGADFISLAGSNRIQLAATGATDVGTAIESWYRTSWFDLGHPAVRKRWKRFEAVLAGGVEQQILVNIYRDYDTSAADRIVDLNVEARDTDLVWDVSLWDAAAWRRKGAYDVIVKGGALGPARAVQLKFVGPTTTWALDAFTLKYITKRVR